MLSTLLSFGSNHIILAASPNRVWAVFQMREGCKRWTPYAHFDMFIIMIEKYINAFGKKGLSALAQLRDNQQTIIAKWARDVVDQYGIFLKIIPGKIKDKSELPYPKETIKIAIKTLIPAYVITKSDNMITLLKDRYVHLSSFQAISPEDKTTIHTEADNKNWMPASSDASLTSTHQKYMQLVLSEEKILLEDIEAFCTDL